MTSTRIRLLTLVALSAAFLAGCGRTGPQLALPAAAERGSAVEAKRVSPDKEYGMDLRRARTWRGDAELVMAIHTTALNTMGISASANVFFSKSSYHREQPCVFVARHYGFSSIAQYREIGKSADYEHVAAGLKPIGQVMDSADSLKAEAAWSLIKGYKPEGATKAPGRFIVGSRAFLVDEAGGKPAWAFYANDEKFLLDAFSKAVTPVGARLDPADPLPHHDPVKDRDIELQRASMVWLPTSLGQANDHQQN